MNVAFIGLGIMGSRMALNVQKAGHNLTVYNRTREKARGLLDKGATWADSPAEAAQDAEVILTMLAHPEAVSAVALGKEGFLDAAAPGSLWLDSSTLNPSVSKGLAHEAELRNVRFLDAPVAGSKVQAEAAQLVFFAGGDENDVGTATPLLKAMGAKTVHVGGHGTGTSLKMVVNHLLGSAMAGFSEAVVLGEALGLPQPLLFNVLLGGPVTPPYLSSKREKLETSDYDPEFPLRWMHKDMQMVTSAAAEAGVSASLANLVKEHYQEAVQLGLGELDFSALYSFLRRARETS